VPLKVYNTLTKKEEEFKPLNPPKVNMYVCGITPYDEAHLGHGRAYVTFDIIARYLKYKGFKLNYIQNITDIDDKIIKRANELGKSTDEIAKKYTESYFDVMDSLNVERASKYVKATEHIKDMIRHIQKLIEKGFAYEMDGDVCFEIDKFKDYGKLSKRTKKSMMAGARVQVNEKKKSPLDFALWKAAKEGEPSWDSPWGKGRPGWHIECSTMSGKYLGDTFDIHGGGLDLVFPHHENEIAQAEAATGKQFVKYWIHNGFVTINREKMSKSLGNFFTLKEIFEKFPPQAVRFFFLQTHYRSPINFSDQLLKDAEEGLKKIYEAVNDFDVYSKNPKGKGKEKLEIEKFKNEFEDAMDNDFNTAAAISVIFRLISLVYTMTKRGAVGGEEVKKARDQVVKMCGILGLEIKTGIPEDVKKLAKERDEARKKKDFKRSDEIRDKLEKMGYIVKDTPSGTSVTGGL